MPLTKEEKARVRSHLGFSNVSAVSTYALGTPAALETQFIIEGAMDRILVEAEPLFRETLGVLDKILCLKVENLENLAVDELGDIKLRRNAQQAWLDEYAFWCGRLCDVMGVYPNPFSKAMSASGGLNVSVQH